MLAPASAWSAVVSALKSMPLASQLSQRESPSLSLLLLASVSMHSGPNSEVEPLVSVAAALTTGRGRAPAWVYMKEPRLEPAGGALGVTEARYLSPSPEPEGSALAYAFT